MRRQESIWITGVGTANALGTSFAECADAFLAGRSGVRAVTRFDVSQHPSRVAAVVENVPVPPGWDANAFAALGRAEQLFLWCGVQALCDAGWWERRGEVRIGLVLGFGAESSLAWEADWSTSKSVMRPEHDRKPLLHTVRQQLGVTGPGTTVSVACASANLALALARRWLELGWADVCLAGGGDMAVTPMSMAAFGNLGALSKRNADPAAASRPFDCQRDGLVMGEGGALFVLEKASHARRRGARVYAELAGCGASSDAFHMVIPNSDPTHAAAAMRFALADAGINSDEIDYINAHATSTPAGDAAEARALRSVLGEATDRVPVSGTKSMTGHALSGAAAVDAVACLTALERQALPPTINLDEPDPQCALCHVPREARPHHVRIVLSNSFGFGGSNTAVVFRKVA
jgi:3-oxoacyl-[acyl-carrier-protein] synthase II